MSLPSRLLLAVSTMATLAEGSVGELHMALMTAIRPHTILVDSNMDPELLFTTPPSDCRHIQLSLNTLFHQQQ